jgi:HK97 family phage major capsid protein
VQGYIPQLLPMTALGRLGATSITLNKNSTLIPYGAGALIPTCEGDEITPTTATAPSFGMRTAVRHTVLTCTSVSRQLLLQSNIDDILTAELRRATAAAIDAAGIAGSGTGGQPLGLLNNTLIPTAAGGTLGVSGAGCDDASGREFQRGPRSRSARIPYIAQYRRRAQA